jgi:hypothetical protein
MSDRLSLDRPIYFCIPNKRIALTKPCDIIVGTPDGEDRIWGDRWDHLDGVTLVVYRDNTPLHTYIQGEWTRCYRDPEAWWTEENWPPEVGE